MDSFQRSNDFKCIKIPQLDHFDIVDLFWLIVGPGILSFTEHLL